MSIAQLEPAPEDDDPYNRQPDKHPPPVENDGTSDDKDVETPSYKIERLLQKRITRRGRGKPTTQYLVKWKGYNHSHSAWYDVKDLKDAKDLIDDYERGHRWTNSEYEHTIGSRKARKR